MKRKFEEMAQDDDQNQRPLKNRRLDVAAVKKRHSRINKLLDDESFSVYHFETEIVTIEVAYKTEKEIKEVRRDLCELFSDALDRPNDPIFTEPEFEDAEYITGGITRFWVTTTNEKECKRVTNAVTEYIKNFKQKGCPQCTFFKNYNVMQVVGIDKTGQNSQCPEQVEILIKEFTYYSCSKT